MRVEAADDRSRRPTQESDSAARESHAAAGSATPARTASAAHPDEYNADRANDEPAAAALSRAAGSDVRPIERQRYPLASTLLGGVRGSRGVGGEQ